MAALLYPKLRERPAYFRLNQNSPLYDGLVFAGLGDQRCIGGMDYWDSSPYCNMGKLTNMDAATDWVWVPELSRFALDFDGLDDYVAVPRGTHDWTGTVTVACWYFPRVTYNGCTFGFNYDREFDCRLLYSSTYWYQSNGAGGYDAYRFPATSLNAWGHNCIFRDSATKQIKKYNNGNPVGSAATYTNTPYSSTYPFYIGRRYSGVYENAIISDLCVWLRVLFPAEIAALADPSNVDLRVSGVPLILPPRRRMWPVAIAGEAATASAHFGGVRSSIAASAKALASAASRWDGVASQVAVESAARVSAAKRFDGVRSEAAVESAALITGEMQHGGVDSEAAALAPVAVTAAARWDGVDSDAAALANVHVAGAMCWEGVGSEVSVLAFPQIDALYLYVDAADIYAAGAGAADIYAAGADAGQIR